MMTVTRTTNPLLSELVYLDIASQFSGVRQKAMYLWQALDIVHDLRKRNYNWAIHRPDGVLLAETKGMRQALVDFQNNEAMSHAP